MSNTMAQKANAADKRRRKNASKSKRFKSRSAWERANNNWWRELDSNRPPPILEITDADEIRRYEESMEQHS